MIVITVDYVLNLWLPVGATPSAVFVMPQEHREMFTITRKHGDCCKYASYNPRFVVLTIYSTTKKSPKRRLTAQENVFYVNKQKQCLKCHQVRAA